MKTLADALLVSIADQPFNTIALPGGTQQGAECFCDIPLLVEKVHQTHLQGNIVAAICAAPALVLQHHDLFPVVNMTGFPGIKEQIPANKLLERRVVYDTRVNLLTSQGTGTAIEFALKLIDLLLGKAKAAEIAAQLVLIPGMYDLRD